MFIIETKNLAKSYGSKQVLFDVSINVSASKVFGLIGPNGAGKTTFIKSILNLTKIKSGSVLIQGKPATAYNARKNVAFLPEKFNFFPYYSVYGTLAFYAKMYEVDKLSLREKIHQVLRKLKLFEIQKQKVKTLSKGQLQRLGIAALVISDAPLLIVDEPFTGLDPIGIKDLKSILLELKKVGKTIFINSHILSEVEQICDEIAVLNEGKVLSIGPIDKLKGDQTLENFFYNSIEGNNVT
ncbi:MAG: ABC transporter ATP-binding protein [Bacteriovoracaceae bacterium]|nr:ABC transporter ATP-binding protein [Bacteriovoracaceae bacterium]